VMLVAAMLIAGVGVFTVRYLGFFQQGAKSVAARFDYWAAAGQNIKAHPLFGSGPGTFATVYQTLKRPDAEMARLVHNDYLQQASDSGILAAMLFVVMVGYVLLAGCRWWKHGSWTEFGVILGLTLLLLQSLVEFGFYVPATAWCWFALAGWVVGRGPLGFDKKPSAT